MNRRINNKKIMLTICSVLFMAVTFLGGISIVNADEALDYEKSFILIEIQQGDTLSSIAYEYAISEAEYQNYVDEVKKINNLQNDVIHSGCYLLIPIYEVIE